MNALCDYISGLVASVSDDEYLSYLASHVNIASLREELRNDFGLDAPPESVLDAIVSPLESRSFSLGASFELREAVAHLVIHYRVGGGGERFYKKLFVGSLCIKLSAERYFDESPGVEGEALALIVDSVKAVQPSYVALTLRFIGDLLGLIVVRPTVYDYTLSGWILAVVALIEMWCNEVRGAGAEIIARELACSRLDTLPRDGSTQSGIIALSSNCRQLRDNAEREAWEGVLCRLSNAFGRSGRTTE